MPQLKSGLSDGLTFQSGTTDTSRSQSSEASIDRAFARLQAGDEEEELPVQSPTPSESAPADELEEEPVQLPTAGPSSAANEDPLSPSAQPTAATVIATTGRAGTASESTVAVAAAAAAATTVSESMDIA